MLRPLFIDEKKSYVEQHKICCITCFVETKFVFVRYIIRVHIEGIEIPECMTVIASACNQLIVM